MTRLAGLALAGGLVAGGALAVPMSAPPAQAAVVSPIVTAITKPKIKKNLPVRKVVTVGKTATFKVRASGSKLKYQWYRSKESVYVSSGFKMSRFDWKKVPGKAGKRPSLKVKATLGKSGMFYRVVVSNSKGKRASRASHLVVRSTLAKPFSTSTSVRMYTAHWSWVNDIYGNNGYSHDFSNNTSLVVYDLKYLSPTATSGKRNPKGRLTVAFRAKNGQVFKDVNANGTCTSLWCGQYGVNSVGALPYDIMFNNRTASAAVRVPTSLSRGGTWMITDSSAPKMTIYVKGSPN